MQAMFSKKFIEIFGSSSLISSEYKSIIHFFIVNLLATNQCTGLIYYLDDQAKACW